MTAPASSDKPAATRPRTRTAKAKPAPKPKAAPAPEAKVQEVQWDEAEPPPQLLPGGGPADDLIVIPTSREPTTSDEPETVDEPETIPVFSVDDVTYSMPAKPAAQQALLAIWNLRKHGDLVGGMEVIEDVCGAPALHALLTAPGVTDTHIIRIASKMADTLFAPAQEAVKN